MKTLVMSSGFWAGIGTSLATVVLFWNTYSHMPIYLVLACTAIIIPSIIAAIVLHGREQRAFRKTDLHKEIKDRQQKIDEIMRAMPHSRLLNFVCNAGVILPLLTIGAGTAATLLTKKPAENTIYLEIGGVLAFLLTAVWLVTTIIYVRRRGRAEKQRYDAEMEEMHAEVEREMKAKRDAWEVPFKIYTDEVKKIWKYLERNGTKLNYWQIAHVSNMVLELVEIIKTHEPLNSPEFLMFHERRVNEILTSLELEP